MISSRELEDFQKKNFKEDYRLRAILKSIPRTAGKILDIGSGNGEIAISLSKYAKVIYATDNSKILLEKLKKKTKKISNLKIRMIDAESFCLKENNFNLITACDLVEHLKNDVDFFKNCYRHLENKGKLFVCVPAGKFLYGVKDKKYGHYRRYSKNEIIKKISQAGFSILRCQYWNFIGVLPYFVSEKVFKKALVGPARHQVDNFFSKFLNRFLYFWLVLEGKINFLPIGLSLIILAGKKKDDRNGWK